MGGHRRLPVCGLALRLQRVGDRLRQRRRLAGQFLGRLVTRSRLVLERVDPGSGGPHRREDICNGVVVSVGLRGFRAGRRFRGTAARFASSLFRPADKKIAALEAVGLVARYRPAGHEPASRGPPRVSGVCRAKASGWRRLSDERLPFPTVHAFSGAISIMPVFDVAHDGGTDGSPPRWMPQRP